MTASVGPNRLVSPRTRIAGPRRPPSAWQDANPGRAGPRAAQPGRLRGRGLGRRRRGQVAQVHPLGAEVLRRGERYSLRPGVAEQRVVDGHGDPRRDPPDEGDGVAGRGPRRVQRQGEDVDLARLGVVGVAGVEERRLALGPQDHAQVGDARDELVDEGVPLADRGDLARPRRASSSPATRCCAARPSATQLLGGLRLGQQPASGLARAGRGSRSESTWSGCWWVTRTASRSVRS